MSNKINEFRKTAVTKSKSLVQRNEVINYFQSKKRKIVITTVSMSHSCTLKTVTV